eukprot:scaffold127536_cov16-Tisochrysis_lutea.AAC.4
MQDDYRFGSSLHANICKSQLGEKKESELLNDKLMSLLRSVTHWASCGRVTALNTPGLHCCWLGLLLFSGQSFLLVLTEAAKQSQTKNTAAKVWLPQSCSGANSARTSMNPEAYSMTLRKGASFSHMPQDCRHSSQLLRQSMENCIGRSLARLAASPTQH